MEERDKKGRFKKGMKSEKKIELDEVMVKNLYLQENKSAKDIGDIFNCSATVVYRVLNEIGVKRRCPWNLGLTKESSEKVKQYTENMKITVNKLISDGKRRTNSITMKKKYASGELTPPMQGKTHTKETKDKLSRCAKGQRRSPATEFKKGMKPWCAGKKIGPPINKLKFNESQKKDVINKYVNELKSVSEIGKSLGCSDKPIYRILKEAKIEINHGKRMSKKYCGEKSKSYIKLNDKEIIKLYKKGLSSRKIAEIMGVEKGTILSRLRKNNVERRNVAFGYKEYLETDDGHRVRSSPEVIIDNWLFHNQIQHSYGKNIADTNYKYDFYIPEANIYIEYWGLQCVESYRKKTERKIEIYKKLRLTLLSIFPKDNIQQKLNFLLKYSKNQSSLVKFRKDLENA